MKKITLNEMQQIQGGSRQFACFAMGVLTIASITQPFTIIQGWPGIKYCWNN